MVHHLIHKFNLNLIRLNSAYHDLNMFDMLRIYNAIGLFIM